MTPPLDMEAIRRRAEYDSGLEAFPYHGYEKVAREDSADPALPLWQQGTRAHHDARLDRRDLIAEVDRLKAERTWRPIETAPRDGTRILCSHPLFGVRVMHFEQGEWWLSGCSCSDDGPPVLWMPTPPETP